METFIPRVGLILNLSASHLRSAHHMAMQCYKTEEEFKSDKSHEDGIPFYSHRAYVTSSIFLSVAFLEARINELLLGMNCTVNPWNKGDIDDKELELIKNIAQIDGVGFLKTVEKYKMVLAILDNKRIIQKPEIFENIELLIKLRNNLIHFKPEHVLLIPENQREEHKLLRLLKRKFPLNPIAQYLHHSQYPDILLGYGCAKWAVTSCINFVEEFNNTIKIRNPYGSIEDLP